jgi:hypothetical protein
MYEVEYRIRKDGITLHFMNVASGQEIFHVKLNKAELLEMQSMLAKIVPLVGTVKRENT